jgi:C4-dicarboxylate-specific signal transduction histidine kinase
MKMEQEDLVRMNRVLRHRLRNYASGIRSTMSLLSKELKERLTSSEQEYFPLVIRECDELVTLTARLGLLFDDLPARGEDVVFVAVEQALAGLRSRFPTVRVQFDLDPAAAALRLSGARYLALCLEEFLVNACESAPACDIRVRGTLQDGGLALAVQDDGPGADPATMDDLFRPFFTTKARHLGLGLAIARRLIRELGGDVKVSRPSSGGFAVELRVPAR